MVWDFKALRPVSNIIMEHCQLLKALFFFKPATSIVISLLVKSENKASFISFC